jgi:hypothetical protein
VVTVADQFNASNDRLLLHSLIAMLTLGVFRSFFFFFERIAKSPGQTEANIRKLVQKWQKTYTTGVQKAAKRAGRKEGRN